VLETGLDKTALFHVCQLLGISASAFYEPILYSNVLARVCEQPLAFFLIRPSRADDSKAQPSGAGWARANIVLALLYLPWPEGRPLVCPDVRNVHCSRVFLGRQGFKLLLTNCRSLRGVPSPVSGVLLLPIHFG